MPETLTYTYTTTAEIIRFFSLNGYELNLDDLSETQDIPDQTSMMTDIVASATDWINLYCGQRYSEANLANSRWVRYNATIYGVYLLCRRRGNPVPEAISEMVEKIEEYLEKIKNLEMNIPRMPTLAFDCPTMSNYRIDDRFIANKIRVEPSISTGGTYPGQDSLTVDPNVP